MSYVYKESELYFNGYNPHHVPGDNPNIRGKIDRDRFDRHEKYEIVPLINEFAKLKNLTMKKQCRLVEAIIHEHLPSNIVMRVDVLKWLSENFTKWDLKEGSQADQD
ncbi:MULTISPECIES: hypothetical protein [Pedobacter]|uniref:hypothetical protein n=1 Tax=Pedobacter TaxID=84567 RepID=UPI00103B7188|nr:MULTISPECIES: hypothetical protein [Pedobacter]MDY0905115.1 hypothetical protein [Pedobacter sp. CFBP9032]